MSGVQNAVPVWMEEAAGEAQTEEITEANWCFIAKNADRSTALWSDRGLKMEIDGINITGVFEVGPIFSSPKYTVGKIVTTSPARDGTYWGFSMTLSDFGCIKGSPDNMVCGKFQVDPASGYLKLVENLEGSPSGVVEGAIGKNPDWFLDSFMGDADVVKALNLEPCE